MKVRVCYTTDASDEYRRALAHQWGNHGDKASREDIRNHLEQVGSAEDDDIMAEWQDCEDGCHP